MRINKDTNFLIIGLGLMGGSYASALSKQGYNVRAITLNQSDIDYAVNKKMIISGSNKVEPNLVGSADILISALYPTTFIEWIEKYQHLLSPNTIITDVSGVKATVVKKIQSLLRDDVEFIPAHPMAGREKSGIEFSDDSVFKGANYIITPTEKNSPEAIEACRELGHLLGFSNISELSVEEHDEMIGFLSQLTHCIAVTLMTCNDKEDMEKYTGDSFRDLTRIAKINDLMWSELFLLNRDTLLRQMDKFIAEFNQFRGYLADGNREEMRKLMQEAGLKRTKFDKK